MRDGQVTLKGRPVYNNATPPLANDGVIVGDLWVNTTTATLNRCISISPITFTPIEMGGNVQSIYANITSGQYQGQWTLYNAYYDGTNFQRINTADYAFALAFLLDIPYETNDSGILFLYCQPGSNPISNTFGSTAGWQNNMLMTQYGDMVIGGEGIEIDGSGTLPYGRIAHSTISSTTYTGIMENFFLDGSGVDSSSKDSWFCGVVGNSLFEIKFASAGQTFAQAVTVFKTDGTNSWFIKGGTLTQF